MTFKSHMAAVLAAATLAGSPQALAQGSGTMTGPNKNFNTQGARANMTPPAHPHDAVRAEATQRGTFMARALERVQDKWEKSVPEVAGDLAQMYGDFTNASGWKYIDDNVHNKRNWFPAETRLSKALLQMKQSGKAQVYGEALADNQGAFEFAASLRPNGSTLLIAREQNGRGAKFSTELAVEIDAQGRVRPAEAGWHREFGLTDTTRGRLPLEPREAFTAPEGKGAKPAQRSGASPS